MVAALDILSHCQVHKFTTSVWSGPATQLSKTRNPYISMRFSSTAGLSSMSLPTEVSVPYTFMVNNQQGLEETA